MEKRKINAELIASELVFTSSRSSGAGGQNVNKVNSKVTLSFDVLQSLILTSDEKEVIARKLGSRMTKDGLLILASQESRSQLQNKEAVVLKLDTLLQKAFTERKRRKLTKPTKASREKRYQTKQKLSVKKQWRQKPE